MAQSSSAKKLKSKKLEERIAPGMVGGGVVDPGMTDSTAPDDTQQPVAQETSETELKSGSEYIEQESPESGTYTNENYNSDGAMADSAGEADLAAGADSAVDTNFDSADAAPSGDFMVEPESWREPDWVTANADGSVTIQPPEGVSVENGIASFPVEVANDALPLPENVTLQADGSVNVEVPEGTQYNAELGTLTLPAGEAEPKDVPQEFQPVVNPDGTLTVTLPETGAEYNPDTGLLNLSNDLANDIAPSHMEIADDGSVAITLPEGTEYQADGSFTVPADEVHFMDNPPPEYVADLSFAEYQPDGSCQFSLPDGATVNDGYANFPHDLAVEELPVPDDVQLNADGTANIGLPDGAKYDAEINAIGFPAGTFNPDDCPQGIQYYGSADGSYTVMLADGMNYDAGSNTVHMNNYWVNEFAPDPVYINGDGSVSVELPPATEYASPGEFSVPAGQVDFLNQPTPDYVHDASFAAPVGDGSYAVTPPDGAVVTDTQIQFPNEILASEVPLPHDMTVLPDGSIQVTVPEGTAYNEEFKQLTFPQGTVQLTEIPEGVSAHLNPDGTVTAVLPPGISYDSGVVTMDNNWANEFAPPGVEIGDNGAIAVTLPPNADFQPDGTFVVPAESADFIQNPDPSYAVGGPEWVAPNPDGSVTFEPPKDIVVNAGEGTMTMTAAQALEHFDNYMPPDVQFYPDGSISMPVPEGTTFNADLKALTIPAGNLTPAEIPNGIAYTFEASGAVTIQLPPGIDYNAETGTVKMDNYWANEVSPQNVEIQANGQIQVDLPPHTEYFDNGAFTVPANYADFVDAPAPDYVHNGPEWVNASPDGTVMMTPPPDIQIHPESGTATMSIDAMNEHFENQIPDEVTLNPDGTMDVKLPDYVQFDAQAGIVTFPADTAHMHMPPPELQPYFNEDGSLSVKLPEGITFDAATNQVHLNNYWTNELTPPNMDIGTDGQVEVRLPDSTHYSDGACSIPPQQADFMNEPQPEYVSHGPEWVDGNPDGSFTVHPPEGMTVDPAAGTVSMSMEMFKAEMDPPSDVTFHQDGTADMKLPEGTTYDATANSLTFPAGQVQPHEIPPQIPYTMAADGTISVQLPEGITYNADGSSVHMSNEWVNTLAPEPLTIGTDGTVQVQLPPDTQYFADGGFVVSAESAHFMDDGSHNQVPQYNAENPYPEYNQPYQQAA